MSPILSAARRRWMQFWFAPVRATNLGVSRLLFFSALTAFYLPHDFSIWGSVTPALRQPIWLFDRFGIPVFAPPVIAILQEVWKVSLFLSCIGLLSRVSLTVTAVLGTYLLGLPHNFGQIYHFDALLVLAFWILAFSRAGDAWSVDSLIRTFRRPEAPAPAPSGEYTWPIQLILCTLALVFFAAGVAKLWTSGAEWIFSDQIAILLRRVQYHISDADPVVGWGNYLAGYPLLTRALAAVTILTETLYPLALFSRRLRPFLVLGGICLIVGIRLLMGPTFEQFLTINVFWVPWDRVGARLRARMPERTAMTVFFDGACGLCRPTIAVLRRLDLRRRVEFLDVYRDWPSISRRYPTLSREDCLVEMQGVDAAGRRYAGFDTYRRLARVLPLGWLALPFLHLPPVAWLGRRVYRAIADRRHGEACPLPSPADYTGASSDADAARERTRATGPAA